jgi:predicted O-methyltransferase YrrM
MNSVVAYTTYMSERISRMKFSHWFRNKEFSTDWTSEHLPTWHRIFSSTRTREMHILEIGAWEGRSTLFFLKYFPRSKIVCIDTFEGAKSQLTHPVLRQQVCQVERRFDRNLAEFGHCVQKIKSCSVDALDALLAAGQKFDLAYVDGDHERASVWADTIRTWPLVVSGGIIIWDDYGWRMQDPSEGRPQAAIDHFLAELRGHYELFAKGYQVIVRRTS